jgi:hypothetical protein
LKIILTLLKQQCLPLLVTSCLRNTLLIDIIADNYVISIGYIKAKNLLAVVVTTARGVGGYWLRPRI